MSGFADTKVILAAHGAGDCSEANRRIAAIAAALSAEHQFSGVTAAFKLGTPSWLDAAQQADAGQTVVVPVMTSDGYFRRTVLPRSVEAAQSAGRVRITPPVGTHPLVRDAMCRLVRDGIAELSRNGRAALMVIVGHGTAREPRSRQATLDVCDSLCTALPHHEIMPAYLDAEPRVEDVVAESTVTRVVVAPFFIGGGRHATTDIADRLGVRFSPGRPFPARVMADNRELVFCAPLLDTEELVEVIRDLAAGCWERPTRSPCHGL